jgi:hypothetical protein
MLFQHDPSQPIGVWLDLREDLRGLYARGRLIPEVVRARELIALLKAGTADGLSIGFRTVRGRLDPKTRVRKLDQIDLWEISIVTFPLLSGARLALASGASGQREQLQKSAALASGASGQREQLQKSAALASGASGQREQLQKSFQPERLFRKQPRYRFGGSDDRLSWRELILPERALPQMRRSAGA